MLPTTDTDLTEADVTALRLECFYANPVTDKALILSGMAKTAVARQQWIRSSSPSITEVIDQYPRFEDVPFDLVCTFKYAKHAVVIADIFIFTFILFTLNQIVVQLLTQVKSANGRNGYDVITSVLKVNCSENLLQNK